MKILTVFYSLSGNTKKLAQAILEAAGGDKLELKTEKSMPRGFMKFWVGGKQAVKKETPMLLPFEVDPNGYDLIFLGTPVWAGNFTPAVRSFLAAAKLKNKKIALFCAHGGDNPGKAFTDLEGELVGNEIVGKIDFKMDGISEAQVEKNNKLTADWARDIAGQ